MIRRRTASRKILQPSFLLLFLLVSLGMSSRTASVSLMRVLAVKRSVIAHPTGDPSFAVNQAFPGQFSSEETDPMLMLDFFGPSKSKGIESDPDRFPIGWHPHRGMDICTYMKSGVGRHADSMGNRETFSTPGMQWISVGSGIEHAEGGGTPAGEIDLGFQIWINVPSEMKMKDPKYGTETPSSMPEVEVSPGVKVRVLAGQVGELTGPFKTAVPLQMCDYTIDANNSSYVHIVPPELDNVLLYVYRGSGRIASTSVSTNAVVRLDGTDENARGISFESTSTTEPMCVMMFAGKMIKEPIAWHGPFVMNTQRQIQDTINEVRSGRFPPVRASWNYKRLKDFPPGFTPKTLT